MNIFHPQNFAELKITLTFALSRGFRVRDDNPFRLAGFEPRSLEGDLMVTLFFYAMDNLYRRDAILNFVACGFLKTYCHLDIFQLHNVHFKERLLVSGSLLWRYFCYFLRFSQNFG